MTECPPLLLAGPTGVGKSAVAIALAERMDGEIVSVDSMQVYRGMDIGTAKPSLAERARIRHHLVDVADLEQPFDAARFVELAQAAVEDTQTRGHVPILCGGTGLYFQAFLKGLGSAPCADPQLRLQLAQVPLPDLLRELESRDPEAYEKIDRRNRRRVVRAVEVIRLSGKRFSEQQADWPKASTSPSAASERSTSAFFGLERAKVDLHRRIEERVERMFAQGLVDETRRLLALGLAGQQTPMQALGYRQAVEYLNGARSLEATIDLVKQKTRQYAKRQMTWFRRQASVEWIPVDQAQPVEKVSELVEVRYRQNLGVSNQGLQRG